VVSDTKIELWRRCAQNSGIPRKLRRDNSLNSCDSDRNMMRLAGWKNQTLVLLVFKIDLWRVGFLPLLLEFTVSLLLC
jgi:hypothetical protein